MYVTEELQVVIRTITNQYKRAQEEGGAFVQPRVGTLCGGRELRRRTRGGAGAPLRPPKGFFFCTRRFQRPLAGAAPPLVPRLRLAPAFLTAGTGQLASKKNHANAVGCGQLAAGSNLAGGRNLAHAKAAGLMRLPNRTISCSALPLRVSCPACPLPKPSPVRARAAPGLVHLVGSSHTAKSSNPFGSSSLSTAAGYKLLCLLLA